MAGIDEGRIVHHFAKAGDWENVAWQPFREGVEIHKLYETPDGPAAALLRYAPRGKVPLHEHAGYEHIFILAGSQVDDRGVYGAGSLVINLPGSRHTVYSPEGCVVLVIWQRPVEFVGDEP